MSTPLEAKSTLEQIREKFDAAGEPFSHPATGQQATMGEKVFAHIDREASPRPFVYQLVLLKQTGFTQRDVLHRNGLCACYTGVK